jgi:hypothetical protein
MLPHDGGYSLAVSAPAQVLLSEQGWPTLIVGKLEQEPCLQNPEEE